MRKFLILFLLTSSCLLSQTNFWSHFTLDFPIQNFIKSDDDIFYATSNNQVLRSLDYGITWDTVYTSQSNGNITIDYRYVNNHDNYIAVWQKYDSNVPIHLSTNGGIDWVERDYPNNLCTEIAFNSSGKIYIISSDTLYSSMDLGQSWEQINIPLTFNELPHVKVDSEDNVFISLWSRSNTFPFLSAENIYMYTDIGLVPIMGIGGSSVAYFESVFVVSNGGIFGSDMDYSGTGYNGVTRHYKKEYYNREYPFFMKSAIVENDVLYTSTNEGIKISEDTGQSWYYENSGLTNGNKSIVMDSLGYLYTNSDYGIFKSNFSEILLSQNRVLLFEDTRVSDTTYKQFIFNNPFNFDLYLDSISCSSTLFIVPNLTNISIPQNDSIYIEIGYTPNSIGSFTDTIFIYNNIYKGRSFISGISSQPTLLNLPYNINFGDVQVGDTASLTIHLTSQSINPIRIDSIYIQTGQYFFISQIEYPLYLHESDTISFSVFFVPLVQSILPKQDYVLIRSNALNDPLSLYVKGRGVNPNIVEFEDNIITYFLSECYPNPFNPSTTIEYQVPKTTKVKISVFNLVGEEIAILVNEEQTQGKYKIDFNGANLSSGVYFYKMQAEGFSSTKKFILLK